MNNPSLCKYFKLDTVKIAEMKILFRIKYHEPQSSTIKSALNKIFFLFFIKYDVVRRPNKPHLEFFHVSLKMCFNCRLMHCYGGVPLELTLQPTL